MREAQARFAKFLRDQRTLPADLRGPVLMIAGRYADRDTYDAAARSCAQRQGNGGAAALLPGDGRGAGPGPRDADALDFPDG